MQTPLTFFFAFVVVLALIGLAAWLVRRFAGNRLGTNANRGRMPRLAVIDAAAVDGRRRLVLVRRDNVEHLLMIGGPTDIVVEPNIVRAMPGRDQAPRASVGGELPPRVPPVDTAGWAGIDESADQPEPHVPEPPPRSTRPSFIDEPRRPPALPERRSEPAGFPPDALLARPEPRLEPRNEPFPSRAAPRSEMPRSEPMMPRAARPIEPAARSPSARSAEVRSSERATAATPPAPASGVSAADQNLADMAQRLEAALRRPSGEPRSDSAEPRVGAPPVAPDAPPSRPAPRTGDLSMSPRNEPAIPPVAAPSPKSGFENLEDEMASLLGRPKTPS